MITSPISRSSSARSSAWWDSSSFFRISVILLCPSQLLRRSPEVPGGDEVQMLRASLGVAGCRRLELALQRLGTGGRGAGQEDEEAADQDG
jgi:hypothetical protein